MLQAWSLFSTSTRVFIDQGNDDPCAFTTEAADSTPASTNVGACAELWRCGRCCSVCLGQSWSWARASGIQRWTWPLKVNESRKDHGHSKTRRDDLSGSTNVRVCWSLYHARWRFEMLDLRAVISEVLFTTTRGCMRPRSGRSSPPEASDAAQCEHGLLIFIRPSRPFQCLDMP